MAKISEKDLLDLFLKNNIEVKNAKGEVIATIKAGQEITVIEETTEGKYKIVWKKSGVYAHKNYVSNNKAKGIGPNIRTNASQSGEIIGDIKAGQAVTMGSLEGAYYKVSFEIEGYVEKAKVELGKEVNKENGGLLNLIFGVKDMLLGNSTEGIGGILTSLREKLFGNLSGGTGGLLSKLTGTLTGIMSGKVEKEEIVETVKETGKTVMVEGLKVMGEGFKRLIGGSLTTPQEGSNSGVVNSFTTGLNVISNFLNK